MQTKKSLALMAIGIGLSITPPVLLMYGLSQFKVSALVGSTLATNWFGYCTAIVSFIMIGLGPGSGWLADQLYRRLGSRRHCMLLGSAFGALALIGFALSSDLPVLILCWLAVQCGYGLVTASGFALVAVEVERTAQGKVYGLIGMAIPLCAMASSVLVLGAFAASPMVIKLVLVAAVQGLSVGLIRWQVPERPYQSPVSGLNLKSWRHFYPSFSQYPDFTWLLCSKLCLSIAFAGMKMMPLFYVARLHLNEQQVYELNALAAVGTLFLILASLLSGYLCDRVGKVRQLNLLAPVIVAVALAGFAMAESTLEVIISSCVMSFGIGVIGAVGNLLVNRVLPSFDHYAKDTSLLNASVHIGATLMGLLAPTLILWGTHWGADGYGFFFAVLAGVSLLASVFIAIIPAHRCDAPG